MRIADSRVLSKYFETTGDGNFDFYRCFDCGRILTRHNERVVFNLMDNDYLMRMCPCGSMKYTPTRPRWYEWLTPRVLFYTYRLLLVRGLAAWADGRFPTLIRYIEKMVCDEWEELTVG